MPRLSFRVVPFLLLATSTLGQQPLSSAVAPTPTRAVYAERLKVAGLRNGGRVNEHLYRGAQPRAEGLAQLKKLGVTTIVDLRGEDPNKRDWERHQAESLGIRFVNIPVNGWDPPSNEQVAQFLSLFRNLSNEKIFLHCQYGEDRTGVFVATYRMAYDGWSAQQAMNEMYFFGFNGIWHPSMKSFIWDFPSRLKTAPAFALYRQGGETVTKCDNPTSTTACSN